jgi:hypothetical protein
VGLIQDEQKYGDKIKIKEDLDIIKQAISKGEVTKRVSG